MVNKPKAKGTAAETRVVNFLLTAGLDTCRVVLHGADDQGDIHIRGAHGCVVSALEVKGGKQTAKVSRQQLEDWITEALTEGNNAGMVRAFLVIAKHGASVKDYQVWTVGKNRRLMYLDEFIDHVKGGF
jgi:Holliday junction resolvase